MPPCPNCGAPVPPGARLCPYCGVGRPSEPGAGRGWLGGGLGCGLSALMVLFLGLLLPSLPSRFAWVEAHASIIAGVFYAAVSVGVYLWARTRSPSLARGLGWGLLAGVVLFVGMACCLALVFRGSRG